ncbi:MAG: LytR C-terminal domain-containing protein [Cetobacterium sp.]|uniref:LytR C-terminal domain-containing protein n=1 Tax=Cetobacterium sp. TaxID=2071632 RepID=UPI003F3A9CC3
MNKMGKKSKRGNRGLRNLFFGLIIIVVLGILLMFNLRNTHGEVEKWDKYAIIGRNNIFVIYEDKLAIRIPEEIQVDKERTFKDIIKTKNYEEVLEALNRLLPEKVNHYAIIKYGELDPKTKNSVNMPETVLDNKRYILTSSMENMFSVLYNTDGNKSDSGEITIDILNANGRPGYAKRTGDELLEKFTNLKYTAANNETNGDMSYITLNQMSKEKAQELVMSVKEKYFKIGKEGSIPTLANAVLVLGEEKEGVPVEVIGTTEKTMNIFNELKKDGYKGLSHKKKNPAVDTPIIEYNKEDYFIAYKISKMLNIENMIEKNDLKNKIVILSN